MDLFNNCLAEAPQRVTAFVHRVTTLVSNLWDDQIEKSEEGPNMGNQTDVSLPNNQDVVINVTQTDAGVSAATSLLSQTPLNGQTTGGFDIENPQSLSPVDQDVVITVNRAVRDQTDVGISHTMPISAQATTSFNIESSSRSLSPFEVVSNGNAHEVKDQTVVDMSDTAPLLPQTPVAAQPISSSLIQKSRNLPREGGQNSSGVANAGSGMPSQHSRQPPSPIEGHNNDIIQAVITEAKEIVNRVTVLSLGCLLAAVAAVKGKETAHLKDNPFFTALVSLSFVSLALGFVLHVFISIIPESTPGFVKIVKFTINLSQLVLVYTGCCGFCILFESVAVQVVILVVPLISIGFVAILRYARRN